MGIQREKEGTESLEQRKTEAYYLSCFLLHRHCPRSPKHNTEPLKYIPTFESAHHVRNCENNNASTTFEQVRKWFINLSVFCLFFFFNVSLINYFFKFSLLTISKKLKTGGEPWLSTGT